MRFWISLAVLVAFSGCPRNVNVPDPPGAPKCTSERDCNEPTDGGDACGLVRRCIEGLCEEEPSRVVPCASF